MSYDFLASNPFATVYDDEEPEQQMPEEDKKEVKKEQRPRFDDAQQNYINSLLAEQKRKLLTKNEELILQLETEKNKANTTDAERKKLEDRIETLKTEFATKEELNQRATTKRVKELEGRNSELEQKIKAAEAKYIQKTMRVDLTSAASMDAYNTDTVVAIMGQWARPVEVLDEDGHPTGELMTKVKLPTKTKEGKTVILDLDPADAVKQMKESIEYGNLFKSGAVGGLGGGNTSRKKGSVNLEDMTTEEYMAYRREARKRR